MFEFLFLSPWTALTAAAGAVSVPIIIHLLNRKRHRVIPWAAMRFLLAAQKRTVRKLRIEQWLLLAIRTLLLLLLVLAMVSVLPWMEPLWARIFPGGVGPAVAQSGRTHKIIAIDGSFSMGRRHHDGTSFDRACGVARQIIRDSSPGDGFSLVLVGSPAQALVPGPSDNSANVGNEIQNLRLPHGNSDLAGALAAIDKMTAQPAGKYNQREVYFLTDLQRTFFQGGGVKRPLKPAESTGVEPKPPPETDAWQRIKARASVIFVDVAHESADNLAVTNLVLADPLVLSHSLNAATATIHNFGSTAREQVRVDLLVGRGRPSEEEAKTGSPDVEPFALHVQQQQLLNIPAGAAVPVTFPLEFAAPGEYVVQVQIEDDALPLDNRRSLAVTVRDSVSVLLVNGKPAAEHDEQAAHHVAVALNPSFGTSPKASLSPFRPKVISEAQFADTELGNLDPYDCVFLCDVPRFSESKIRRLELFLQRGGGVVFCLGSQVDIEAYNRLLSPPNGQGLFPVKLVRRWPAGPNQFFNLASEDENFQYAPLSAFAADSDRATLLGARFRQYVQVQVPQKSGVRQLLSFLPPTGSDERKVPPRSTGSAGLDPAVLEWPRHRGRVMLVTTTLNLDWGTWPGSPAFLPFIHELTRHAALGTPSRVVSAGEPLVEFLPSRLAGLDAMVALPDGRTVTLPIQGQEGGAVVRFPETDQSGVYRMTVGASRREYLFAVNVPAATSSALSSESDLQRTDREELKAASPDGDIQIVSDLSQVRHRARMITSPDDSESAPRSSAGPGVARVLLLVFLALLALETILAWRFGSARTAAPREMLTQESPRAPWRRWIAPGLVALAPLLAALALGAVLAHEALTGEFLGFLPGSLRASLERGLGVPEAAPGEGTRWKLDYLPYLTGQSSTDRWLALGLALAAAGLVFAIYRAERVASLIRVPGETTPSSRSFWSLAASRLALFLLALLVLLPQLRLFFEREGWPDVAILIDTSRSMSKADTYQDPDIKERTEQLAVDWVRLAEPRLKEVRKRIDDLEAEQARGPGPARLPSLEKELAEQRELAAELQSPNRLNLVKALIAVKDDDWVHRLLSRRQLKVHVYQCSNRTVRLAEVIDEKQADSAVSSIHELRPLGDSSQLGAAVRAVLHDFRGGSLGAIIMFTDGVTTEGDDLLQAARHAARADVSLYFVGTGDALEPRDLILHDLQVEDSVNVRDRLVFDARVSAKGNLGARSVPVILWERNKDGALTELARQIVALDPGKPIRVRLVITPTEPGDHSYVIQVPEQPDETDKSNNQLMRVIHVAEVKPVKLLYIEGYPRYEYRFIKTLLERERNTKLGQKSIELKVLLADADDRFPSQDKSAIGDFPSRDELFAFDAVILGDVDPKHPKLGERNLQLLRDFVRERGGGLLLLAGEQYLPQSYRESPLADVMPVAFGGEGEAAGERSILEASSMDGYRPVLTVVGQQHPIFRFVTEDAENATIWAKFPPLHWLSSGYRAKPASEVLAVHPHLPARRSSDVGEGDLHPLVIQQFVGAGRSMFFGFDDTWRWRYRENEIRFNQFWIQTVRFLARSRVGRVELRLDKQTPYRRGEPIRVTVRFPDDAPAPPADSQVKVIAERGRLRRGGETNVELLDTQTVQLAKVKGSRATYEALLTRTPEGEYKFWLASPPSEVTRTVVENRVLPPPGEMDRLRMNQPEMEQAAKESHGRFYSFAEADRLPDDLPAGTRIALNQPRPPWLLWNHSAVFLLALGLFTSEWIGRKRRRLL
jgi:hypothetical protein